MNYIGFLSVVILTENIQVGEVVQPCLQTVDRYMGLTQPEPLTTRYGRGLRVLVFDGVASVWFAMTLFQARCRRSAGHVALSAGFLHDTFRQPAAGSPRAKR